MQNYTPLVIRGNDNKELTLIGQRKLALTGKISELLGKCGGTSKQKFLTKRDASLGLTYPFLSSKVQYSSWDSPFTADTAHETVPLLLILPAKISGLVWKFLCVAHACTSEERALYTLLRVRLPPPREWREKSWYETAKGKLFSGLDRVGEGVLKAVSSSFKYVLFRRFFSKVKFEEKTKMKVGITI